MLCTQREKCCRRTGDLWSETVCVEKFSTSPTIHAHLLEICSRCPTTCNWLCVGERFEADFGSEPPARNKLDASVIRSKVPLAQHPLLYGS